MTRMSFATSPAPFQDRYIIRCQNGTCAEGFQVIEIPTLYGRRPVVQELTSWGQELFQHVQEIEDATATGIYQLLIARGPYDPHIPTSREEFMRAYEGENFAAFDYFQHKSKYSQQYALQILRRSSGISLTCLSETSTEETLKTLKHSWEAKERKTLYKLRIWQVCDGSIGLLILLVLISSVWQIFSILKKRQRGELHHSLKAPFKLQVTLFLVSLLFILYFVVSLPPTVVDMFFTMWGALLTFVSLLIIWVIEGIWVIRTRRQH